MAAIPKFNELSPTIQVVVILAVGAGLWALSEYVWPLPALKQRVTAREADVARLTQQVEPLRPYRERRNRLEQENKQLEAQLENLKQIVPNEKEVDNFVRQVQAEALSSGIMVRRFTARNVSQQEYYVEVPFEVEMDGPFYDVLQFYDRLGKLERIINVSELKMGSIEARKSVVSVPSPLSFEAFGSFVAKRKPNAGRRTVSVASLIFVPITMSSTSCVVFPVTVSAEASGAALLRFAIVSRL